MRELAMEYTSDDRIMLQKLLRDMNMWETTTKDGRIVPIQISSTLIVVGWSYNG